MPSGKEHIVSDQLPFTGERFIPHQTDPVLALEHYHRYLFASTLVKGKVVLDIACGEGYGSAFLSKSAKAVLGLDNDEATIHHAQKKYATFPNVRFAVGRCEDFSVDEHSVDIVVSLETLEHVDRQAQNLFLKNIKHAIKNDGLLVISSPERIAYAEANRGENEFHKHEFAFDEFRNFLEQYFKHVVIVGQKPLSVSAIWELSKWKDELFHFHIAEDLFTASKSSEKFTNPVYLIAVCSDAGVPRSILAQSRSLYYDTSMVEQTKNVLLWAQSLDRELEQRKNYLAQLQKEFEERTTWAHNLNTEVQNFRRRIQELQKTADERTAWAKKLEGEVGGSKEAFQRLQKEFDERTHWAEVLEKELAERKVYISRLQQEFEERTTWAKSLDEEVTRTREIVRLHLVKFEEVSTKLVEVERKATELQLWGTMLEQQLNSIAASSVYRLLAVIGLLPKYRGTHDQVKEK